MKTVFYCRLSGDKRKESGELDIDNQLVLLRKKWGDHEVHQERVSGGKHNRIVLRQLIRTLPKGSTIHAVHLDRVSRESLTDMFEIISTAKARRIKIETLHDGDITSEEEILIAVKTYAAVIERESTSRRIRDHIESRMDDGRGWGAAIAKRNGNFRPGKKEVNPLWEKALPRLQALRNQGMSYEEIVRIATEEFGEKFSKTHVFRLLNKDKVS